MLRVLFLILILMSSVAFAQSKNDSEQTDTPKASMRAEFGRLTNEHISALFDSFLSELKQIKNAEAFIINYGSDREVRRREKIIRSCINYRDHSLPKITFVRGEFRKEIKTEFWIVPEGAKSPTPSEKLTKEK